MVARGGWKRAGARRRDSGRQWEGQMTKVFVGNLSFQACEADLRELCARYGKLESVEIVHDKTSGKSKGFGFVGFAMSNDAESAVKELSGREFMGRDLRVEIANGNGDRGHGRDRGRRDRGRERGAVSGRY